VFINSFVVGLILLSHFIDLAALDTMTGSGSSAEAPKTPSQRATLRQRFKNQLDEMGDKSDEMSVRIKRNVRGLTVISSKAD